MVDEKKAKLAEYLKGKLDLHSGDVRPEQLALEGEVLWGVEEVDDQTEGCIFQVGFSNPEVDPEDRFFVLGTADSYDAAEKMRERFAAEFGGRHENEPSGEGGEDDVDGEGDEVDCVATVNSFDDGSATSQLPTGIEMAQTITATNLAELRDILNAGTVSERALSDLPTFGGAEPCNTRGIYSWDETNLLVAENPRTGASEWTIVHRADYEA